MKRIFITNGTGGSGKDTFAELLNEIMPVYKYSSIDKIKEIAKQCGWLGGKTERDRKFLSDLKLLTTEYSDLSYRHVDAHIHSFLDAYETRWDVMLIDIREPEEIDKVKKTFNAQTILIENPRIPDITSNMADANVRNYTYDYVIVNDGTLDDFRETIREWATEVLNVN